MKKEPISQLAEIRDLMERSSRFISLSGLSGVAAGLIALVGSIVAFFYLDYDLRYLDPETYFTSSGKVFFKREMLTLLLLATAILSLAILSAFVFTARKAKKQGVKMWSQTSKLLLINLAIPLITGGFFCLLLLYYGLVFLIAASTLVFYGLALINAGKYTLSEIKWLGLSEIVLGILAMAIPGYGLIVWAFGFGVLHIIYGIAMYYRHEHKKM